LKFEIVRDIASGEVRFHGSFSSHDLLNLKLDPVDRLVINAEAATSADYLQSLEVIYRRYFEQTSDEGGDGVPFDPSAVEDETEDVPDGTDD
jgi:hypothetical protein